jgi:hypothetical protein
MTELTPGSINVLLGLTADGKNRIQEAMVGASDEKLRQLKEIAESLPESFSCDCQDCGTWDGLQRRCQCGNRRVYWSWNHGIGWLPEVY